MLIFFIANMLGKMSSVEKIHEYVKNKNFEKPFELEEDKKHEDWPKNGKIEVKNLKIRYREKLPLVLNGVNFVVEPMQKVGIVGRTGSGKSTTLLCLMRILEQTEPGSSINIDGVDISKLGLHKLRKNITIIPQDPYLLQGTLKSNLDPEGLYKDIDVLNSLNQVDFFSTLKEDQFDKIKEEKANKNNKKLESIESNIQITEVDKLLLPIEDSGSNLSLGQRQLVCIARALIKKPKILLMDEATANIDQKTDQIIQRVVTFEMPETTVLTIAHRLNTIIQYDKIVVLENGKKAEEGSPVELIKRGGIFSEMVEKGGKNYKEMLLRLAQSGRNSD